LKIDRTLVYKHFETKIAFIKEILKCRFYIKMQLLDE